MKKLFGNHIQVDCHYCQNTKLHDENFYSCKLDRKLSKGKCRKFVYDPLLRVPQGSPILQTFDAKDFKLD
ncbi:MAG: hypothetical protein Q8876_06120 [Bacillota bacterium]|nr:hypothetical protein [Bacillota bacterium]